MREREAERNSEGAKRDGERKRQRHIWRERQRKRRDEGRGHFCKGNLA